MLCCCVLYELLLRRPRLVFINLITKIPVQRWLSDATERCEVILPFIHWLGSQREKKKKKGKPYVFWKGCKQEIKLRKQFKYIYIYKYMCVCVGVWLFSQMHSHSPVHAHKRIHSQSANICIEVTFPFFQRKGFMTWN